MFRSIPAVLIFSFLLSTSAVFSGDKEEGSPACPSVCPPGKVCPPEECSKSACFNVVCNFEKKDAEGKIKNCQAASTFEKRLSSQGGELLDDSNSRNHPRFEVKCDESMIYNNGSRRFTDLLGTRIQGFAGPYPAIVLPRGELHEGHHYSLAWLELGQDTLRGSCYLYTGPAFK